MAIRTHAGCEHGPAGCGVRSPWATHVCLVRVRVRVRIRVTVTVRVRVTVRVTVTVTVRLS